jgi:DNA-binding transcriptional ArsR family regulator
MGITKSSIFSDRQNEIAAIAKAIGHPARVSILQHMADTPGCICGDLVEETGLAQPTVSQHLKELKRVGLIQGTVEGTSMCYCINKMNWNKIKSMFEQLFHRLETSKCNC